MTLGHRKLKEECHKTRLIMTYYHGTSFLSLITIKQFLLALWTQILLDYSMVIDYDK